jgi:hypothetical protein
VEQPESAHQVDEGVGASKLVQVQLTFGNPVQAGLGAGEPVDRIDHRLLDSIRRIGSFNHGAQIRHGALDSVHRLDEDACAAHVATSFVTNVDCDLVAEP